MADFTGKWRVVEIDEESFVKFFEAMGAPDGRAALQIFTSPGEHEMVDTGDVVIIRIPDPAAEHGQRDIEFKVGEEGVGVGPFGIPVKKFVTREGNKLIFEETTPNGQKNTTVRELQGDKMLFSKRHHGTGATARAVLVREKSKL